MTHQERSRLGLPDRLPGRQTDGIRTASDVGMTLVQVPQWESFSWLVHGFSTRLGGVSTCYGGHDLNLGFTAEDDRVRVEANRAHVLTELHAGGHLMTARQIHGVELQVVSGPCTPVDGDGLLSQTPGVTLGIQVADCVPVLLIDRRLRAVAAVHAGWRGTVEGIAARAAERMRAEFGSRADDLEAAIGPSIGQCCYQVGDEVRDRFLACWPDAQELFEDGRLDLWEANRRQLLGAGVSKVWVAGDCTACSRTGEGARKYFSYRAEAGKTGRAMGVVGIASL